jgi:hypothetical protein
MADLLTVDDAVDTVEALADLLACYGHGIH